MIRRHTAGVLACVLVQLPAIARAQTTLDGSAEWTVAKSSSASNNQTNGNSAFWQNYAVGYSSSLWDPRLVKFNTEGLFRTSSLTSGGTAQPDQQGRQGDLGYKVGVSILPASAMPFFFQASRTTSTTSGDLGPSNPVRSGMIAPSGAPPIDFQALTKSLTLGWQLGLGGLPRIELGYRRGNSVVTGGGYRAEQNDDDLSAAVLKDTARTRQSFRYQRTSFENLLAQTFQQQLNNLDYDLSALLTGHTRVTAHVGRRMTFTRSEFASTVATTDAGAYTPPPSLGAAGSEYLLAGISYDPSGRFSIRLNGTADRQSGEQATTSAGLATLSSHVELVRGLTVTATGTSGVRGQLVGHAPITVSTRSAVGGVTYQAGVRWLTGSVSATRGLGTNTTPEGQQGTTGSWSREAGVSTTFRWLGLGAGYERANNRDGILDYGNYDSERLRASAQTDIRRLSISTSADQLRIERGLAATLAHNLQRTFSGSAALRLWGGSLATATVGGFVNDYASSTGIGRDRTLFWGVGGQTALRSALRLSAWIRSEAAIASRTGFDQQVLSSFGRLEYRLRTLTVAAEYRNSQGRLQYLEMLGPDAFRGRQFRLSISRQFGIRLR